MRYFEVLLSFLHVLGRNFFGIRRQGCITRVHFLEYSRYKYSYSNVKVLRLEQTLGPSTRVQFEKKSYLSHAV